MRDELTKLVYPTLAHGLKVRDAVQRGDQLDFDKEQATLRGLLQTREAARRWPDYAGDGEQFLGVRYALTCWIDEIFIDGTRWSQLWNEKKLETSLYGSNDRAYKFWEQAKIAEARSEIDALEVFYLCMMLGFRGDLTGAPDRVRDWREAVEAQFGQRRARQWASPPELPPKTNVPPLTGRDKFRKSLVILGIVVAILIPIGTFALIKALQS
jgi:type VI secretion system protein ImpK